MCRLTAVAGGARRGLAVSLLCAFGTSVSPAQDLVGVHFDTGEVHRISTTDGSAAPVGATTIPNMAGLEADPDGRLLAFSAGEGLVPTLYRLSPGTGFSATAVGPLGGEVIFEGALVFAPDGSAYGASHDGEMNRQLFRLDVATGASTVIGTISGGSHDINGLAWRSDGMLVGVDRITNSILTIDPATAASSLISVIDDATVGAVGGMTVLGQVGYFTTSGPGLPSPGSNSLYSFDLFTGEHTLIGSLGPSVTGTGISGLAVPEPATLAFLILGSAFVLVRRRSASRQARRVSLVPANHVTHSPPPAGP